MSIIEKAVEKLENQGKKIGSRSLDGPGEAASARITQGDPSEEQAQQHIVSTEPSSAELHNKNIGPSQAQTQPAIESTRVTIPFEELGDQGFITPLTPRSQIAEEFRTIKRPMLMNIAGKGASIVKDANLIMVTSALPGDGKTFCAINLALSIAMEQDKTVLFVDADVAQATAGKMFGIPPGSPGLIDLLEHKGLTVPDVLLPTNVHNLRVIPAGNVHERATELLASQAMSSLMRELSGRYPDRVIIFDSPPLLLTTEASVLANTMGQIAFVVAADSTPQGAINDAIEGIAGEKVIGMILNKHKHYRRSRHGYGYGYGQDGKKYQHKYKYRK